MSKRKVLSSIRLSRDKRAISPAISTVIMTSAIVVLLFVAISFSSTFLDERMAENEFTAMQQFMQTVSLQLDDVAWTIGRTQTVRYASQHGRVNFESLALNYTIYVNDAPVTSFSTGILLFNMPVSRYSLGNNYFKRVYPSDSSFLQQGTSAPVGHVFVTEKMPMNDGDFIRVVVAPSIRMLNSSISMDGQDKNYFKFYLPILTSGTHPRQSQSVTLTGKAVSAEIEGSVNTIEIRVSFLKSSLGFDESFFSFNSTTEFVDVPDDSVLEFYTGEVVASLGQHI